ncbi:MAG TPA: hypothetical protein EYP98_04370 [Planctomycetes bacterium]|nr:hypothetical protein [Planctomycetota bacterium]
MTTTGGGSRQQSDDSALAALAGMGYGGWQATILSAAALIISGFSLYESSFKTADVEVFVPPVIRYARDSGGSVEVFAVPVTITNAGARTGTVLSMELEVENLKTHKKKNYYSAYLGEHQVDPNATNRSFAPLSIAGRETFTDTVRFYPDGDAFPQLVDDAGDYRFTLSLLTAEPSRPDLLDRYWHHAPAPISFERSLPWISEEQLGSRRITIAMKMKAPSPAPGTKAGTAPDAR